MKKFDTKARKIALFSILVALLLSCVVVYAVFDYRFKNLRQDEFGKITNVAHKLFEIKVQEKQKSLNFQLEQMLDVENLAEAVSEKEHEKIDFIIAPYYKKLKISNDEINILTFRDKDNITLYRAHKPEFYGDKLNQKRKIIIDTSSQKRSFSGFEVGNLEITYRVTKPIFYKDNYVGNVEIGIDPKNILKDLNSVFELDVGVVASNSFLDVMLNKSIIYIGDKHFLLRGDENLENYFSSAKKESEEYRVDTGIFLKNHLSETIGFLALGFDTAEGLQKSRNFMNQLFVVIIAVMSVFSIVLFLGFSRMLEYFKDKIYECELLLSAQKSMPNKEIVEKAFEEDRVVPYFQPIVDTHGKIAGYEALMRIVDLRNNKRKVLSPDIFLKETIESELYISLFKDMVKKSLNFFSDKKERIYINFLPDDLFNLIIMDQFTQDIKKFDSSQRVVVEIAERECSQNFPKLLQIIKKLRNLGVLISIDNFDGSFMNNSHVLAIKPDYIKIKGDLVKNTLRDDYSKGLVQKIIGFAKELDIKIVAEFVEDKETFELLKKYGVEEFQGYYFGYPQDLINNQ